MSKGYYLVGEYHEIPVYYSRKYGLALSILTNEFTEPTSLQKQTIIADLGGMSKIELMVSNYERSEKWEAKKNDSK